MTGLSAILLLALAVWAGGSIVIAVLMPWSILQRGDHRLALGFLFGWPFVCFWIPVELAIEHRRGRSR